MADKNCITVISSTYLNFLLCGGHVLVRNQLLNNYLILS